MSEENLKFTEKDKSVFRLIFAGIIAIIVWQLPFGQYILYPFTILGTWFHEMGHGLTSIIVGGNFNKLVIFPNGSGLAYSSYTYEGYWMNKDISMALVSAGGLLGPAIVGSYFIIMGKTKKLASISLSVFSVFVVISLIIWIRSFTGILVLSGFALFFILVAYFGKKTLKQFTIQFLGLQAFVSTYGQLDYLYTKDVVIDGRDLLSDTASIAENLGFGTYWIYGSVIAIISVVLIIYSFKIALKS